VPSRLKSIQFRHCQVHQHYLWLVLFDQPNGFSSVTRLGHNFYVRQSFEQRSDAGAHQLMIVGKQNPDLIHDCLPVFQSKAGAKVVSDLLARFPSASSAPGTVLEVAEA
jgi:hypothetical protein